VRSLREHVSCAQVSALKNWMPRLRSMTNNKTSNPYLKLSSAAIQMAAVIGGFTWLGTYLDTKCSTDSLLTIIGALLGVAIGLYLVIKEVNQLNRENPSS